MKKALFVLGTRPEAIKLAPLILTFQKKDSFEVIVCNTGQHRELTDEVLIFFKIVPKYNLNLMTHSQSLIELQSKIGFAVNDVLDLEMPNLVFVQGDTTTAFVTGLTAFYRKISIVHIEAGLRSYNRFSPFPEEINRVFLSKIADYHFTPTEESLLNLRKENITNNAWNVGNTVIDALNLGLELLKNEKRDTFFPFLNNSKKVILLTTHRRENFGNPLVEICKVVKSALDKYNDIQFVCPVHPNPKVKETLFRELGNLENVHLIEPLNYPNLISLMSLSYLVMSDSGGIQEEAPSLGKPIIVLRDTTERMEGIKSGTAILAGNDFNRIWKCFSNIMDNEELYLKMTKSINPYGDGNSSERIYNIINDL